MKCISPNHGNLLCLHVQLVKTVCSILKFQINYAIFALDVCQDEYNGWLLSSYLWERGAGFNALVISARIVWNPQRFKLSGLNFLPRINFIILQNKSTE